jgi:hypothetical protein
MCCGLLQDQGTKEDVPMARVVLGYYQEGLTINGSMPMDLTSIRIYSFWLISAWPLIPWQREVRKGEAKIQYCQFQMET